MSMWQVFTKAETQSCETAYIIVDITGLIFNSLTKQSKLKVLQLAFLQGFPPYHTVFHQQMEFAQLSWRWMGWNASPVDIMSSITLLGFLVCAGLASQAWVFIPSSRFNRSISTTTGQTQSADAWQLQEKLSQTMISKNKFSYSVFRQPEHHGLILLSFNMTCD